MTAILGALAAALSKLPKSPQRTKRPTPVAPWPIPTEPVRTPDPYVTPPLNLSPYNARWRRWFKATRGLDGPSPHPPAEDTTWPPSHAERPPPEPQEHGWGPHDVVVRPYVPHEPRP
ncbi:hypothetical protein OK074_4006 [Actinobacteria bacterium OK074]|nr:hypothetical protein OK074_4006 [Actinobacteria bacterium OK074]